MIRTRKAPRILRTVAALYTAVTVPAATCAALWLDNHTAAPIVLFLTLTAILTAEKLGRSFREDEYAQWARRRARSEAEEIDAGIRPYRD